MGDFAEVFGSLLNTANQHVQKERDRFEQARDSDIAMYRQIMLDPHAGLGPDADPEAVAQRRTELAGKISSLYGMKGKESPIHKLAGVLNGIHGAASAQKQSVGTNPDGTPITRDPGMSGTPKQGQTLPPLTPNADPRLNKTPIGIPEYGPGQSPGAAPQAAAPGATPQPQGTAGGGAAPPDPVKSAIDQDTQQIKQKTQSLGGKMLTKVAHGLGAGLTALDDQITKPRDLPPLDPSLMPQAPTRMQEATAQGSAEKAHAQAARENEMKIYRDQLHEAAPSMSEEDLDRAVEIKFGARLKPRPQTKIVADANSPSKYSYASFDPISGEIYSITPNAPSRDTSGVTEQVFYDATTGQMVAIPLRHSTTHSGSSAPFPGSAGAGSPGTPGAALPQGAGPQARPGAALPQGPAGASPSRKGLTPLSAPPAGGGGARPQGKVAAGQRPLGNVIKPQQFNTLNTQATAIDEARNSLVGDDPKQVGGLSADLGVFDNPESVDRIMKYLGFIEKNLAGEQARAGGAGPAAAAEWYFQLPVAVSNLQQQAQQELATALTPQEQQFVTDYFRVMGTIGGLRAATKMPGARWSFMNLYNELPTPGRVNNKADAMRRIQNILQETNVVSAHNPLSRPTDLTRLDGTSASPKTAGTQMYRIPGKAKPFAIPANLVPEFLKDHPNAVAIQ